MTSIGCSARARAIRIRPQPSRALGHEQVADEQAVAAIQNRKDDLAFLPLAHVRNQQSTRHHVESRGDFHLAGEFRQKVLQGDLGIRLGRWNETGQVGAIVFLEEFDELAANESIAGLGPLGQATGHELVERATNPPRREPPFVAKDVTVLDVYRVETNAVVVTVRCLGRIGTLAAGTTLHVSSPPSGRSWEDRASTSRARPVRLAGDTRAVSSSRESAGR